MLNIHQFTGFASIHQRSSILRMCYIQYMPRHNRPPLTPISVYVEAAQLEQLRAIAATVGVPINVQVRQALVAYLATRQPPAAPPPWAQP